MDTLLSVLLYIGVVTSPGTYTISQINDLEIIYQTRITAIEYDPILFPEIISDFYPEAEIIIVDNTVG